MSFFADQWRLCRTDDAKERPCTPDSTTKRILELADVAGMPGLLSVTLDGVPVGFGFARENPDLTKNEIYFFEARATGEAIHYVHYVSRRVFVTPQGGHQVEGTSRTFALISGSILVPLTQKLDADEWTANRPTA